VEVNLAYAEYLKRQASAGIAVQIGAEADEFWSYVGKKSEQRWTWYAIDHERGIILAHHNGRRTDAACKALLDKLARFPIHRYYTDNWQSYAKFISPKQHQIGKDETWRIERKNLNFRTHLTRLHRKTIGFSKNPEMHDKVIGLYIERHYYQKNYDSQYHIKNI
jgi:insertion element IS1 protein InsB